jgi:hypothetical protein
MLTVATFDKAGSIEGQFVDEGGNRQCNFQTAPGSTDASNITCSCQKIPVPAPLINSLSISAHMVGLQNKVSG